MRVQAYLKKNDTYCTTVPGRHVRIIVFESIVYDVRMLRSVPRVVNRAPYIWMSRANQVLCTRTYSVNFLAWWYCWWQRNTTGGGVGCYIYR